MNGDAIAMTPRRFEPELFVTCRFLDSRNVAAENGVERPIYEDARALSHSRHHPSRIPEPRRTKTDRGVAPVARATVGWLWAWPLSDHCLAHGFAVGCFLGPRLRLRVCAKVSS
jgi:hypothetical protein